MAQHIQSSWDGVIAIHRYEDLALIRQVVREREPARVVELGTAEGGFAAMLAATVVEWNGHVLTVDHQVLADQGRLLALYDNLQFLTIDVLTEIVPSLAIILARPDSLLYTDNGNKQRELELYAPLMGPHATVGTHDYGTELNAEWAETFMTGLGYQPYRHEDFARLAHPEHYPDSLTRFWVRE
jgi:hypothetical protein